MTTDGVAKKPSRVYLYECAFVISCDEFIVMPVRIKDTFHVLHVFNDTQSAQLLLFVHLVVGSLLVAQNGQFGDE